VTSSTAPWRSSVGVNSFSDARVLSKGGWTFTPGSTSGPEASAFLCYRGNRIELQYSSSVFEGFLAQMSAIQDEFDRLLPGEPTVVRQGERAGQTLHV
jgi:hypothetical protein